MGPYSIGTVLMAVDPPLAPSIVINQLSRTVTSIALNFVPNANTGGSLITGYLLYSDQGIAGSPFTLLFNGTAAPEIIFYNVTGLMTGHTYNFQLYSMNIIYPSATFGTSQVLIGTIPDAPLQPTYISSSYAL